MTFKYKAVERPDGTTVRCPLIPITFIGKEKIGAMALIDSGADVSVITKEFAELLGLNLNKEQIDMYGIGGKVKGITSSVKILIAKGHDRINFSIPVNVVMEKYDFPPLLGRAGFFDRFKIIFQQRDQKIILKPNAPRGYR